MLNNVWHVMIKELKSYFYSPVAYVVLTLFILLVGWRYSVLLVNAVRQTAAGTQYAPFNGPQYVILNHFAVISTVLLFLLPLITMGVYAEEKKKGTIELLFTLPLSNGQIILGKFLANFLFCLLLFVGSGVPLLTLFHFAAVPPAIVPILVGYLGIILLTAAVLSLGHFLSTLTENQIVAAILTFVLVLVLYFFNEFAQQGNAGLAVVLRYLSPLSHLESFLVGTVDASHLIYFLSVWVFGMFLTYRTLESLRWR
jgi:ABC-2 type transport system permease protein